MPCQVLVSNNSGLPKAEIVAIVGGNHKWSVKESMQAFLANGGLFDEWSRTFSIVIITDKDKNSVSFLNDRGEDLTAKWVFIEPATSSEEWQELYFTGQIEREWSAVEQFLAES